MAFTVRLANYGDMEECARVEKESTPKSNGYVRDAWHYFNTHKGDFVCVFDGDLMIGIGRFTVMPDGTGWLEALRVGIPHQRQGAGKAIYKKYIELARQYGCPSIAMYTGARNQVSAGLAEVNGLRLAATHRGYHLTDLSRRCAHGFKPVTPQRAWELLAPKAEEYNGYMITNRTFYKFNEATVKAFAAEGKVYEDETDGSFIVCGARFQHHLALHVSVMGGDYDRCIDFAANLAASQGVGKVSCTFTLGNEKLEEALKARGFTPDAGDLITKELVF